MHQIVECFEAFESFTLLPSCVRLGYASIVIGKREEVSFCTKSHRHNWPNKVYLNELVCSFFSFLGCAIVVLCCFCFFTTIAHTFIFDVVDVVACQVFS